MHACVRVYNPATKIKSQYYTTVSYTAKVTPI